VCLIARSSTRQNGESVSSAWGCRCGRSSCQSVEDWAIRDVVPSTLRDHGAEHALETLQFIKLATDVSNVLFGDALHLLTCLVPTSSEPKKRAHVPIHVPVGADRCDRPRSCLLHYGDLGGSRARSHVADQLSRDVSLSAGLMAIHSA
jgi:hypothetical protein